ncbi:DUF4394 domain-containing protein [Micromonospora sp. M12]
MIASVGITSTPVAAAQPQRNTAANIPPRGLPSLSNGTCGVLWDLLNAGGRNGLVAIGLTANQQLIKFAANRPQLACSIGLVDLPGSEILVGIDYRIQDGALYGVGSTGGIYSLNPRTAAATKVSQLTVALAGTSFGVDFNPAADRLRIISDTGQNLRHNISPGGTTIVDSPSATRPPPSPSVSPARPTPTTTSTPPPPPPCSTSTPA